MTSQALIVAIVGIVVSGVVGPSATAWAVRRAARKQFVRDQAGKRREELGVLLDHAASVLGLGPTRLRQMRDSGQSPDSLSDEQRAWPEQVYTLGQRLRLRLGGQHPVVEKYETVRLRLLDAAAVPAEAEQQTHENAVLRFEQARDAFLDEAQVTLDAPIPDKEQG